MAIEIAGVMAQLECALYTHDVETSEAMVGTMMRERRGSPVMLQSLL